LLLASEALYKQVQFMVMIFIADLKHIWNGTSILEKYIPPEATAESGMPMPST
jgi:hypothetical protein